MQIIYQSKIINVFSKLTNYRLFPNMQKCKAFQTVFLQTLQITYRLDHNEEEFDSGVKVLSGLPTRIRSLYVLEQYVPDLQTKFL
jgi:hypothetical protein